MTSAHPDTWTEQRRRLFIARDRFNDSVRAIRDLGEFVTEHISKLDTEQNLRISINPVVIRDIGDQNFDPFMESLHALITTLNQLVEPWKSKKDTATDKLEAKKLVSDTRQAMENFKSSLPEDIDRGIVSFFISPEMRTRTSMMLASLLTTVVGDFEVLFSEVVSFFYRLRPDALKAQDAQLSWAEIDLYGSLDELRGHFIDERVSQLMWKGFDDWMQWLDRQLKVQYVDIALDPVLTTEVFQRRHVIVHNGGLVSPQYVAKMASKPALPKVGDRLYVDRAYLNSAVDQLTVLGVSIVYRVMRKLATGDDQQKEIDSDILACVFDLLKERRDTCVTKLASNALPSVEENYSKLAVQVNSWIALKRTKGIEAIRQEVSRWDISALGNMFKLAKLILLDDPSAVNEALIMVYEEEISRSSIDEWPLFESIRESVNEGLKPAQAEKKLPEPPEQKKP